MSQAQLQRTAASGTKRLAEAVRAAKIASAQRTDIVVDIREADRARLEMFAEELQPIADAVPAEDDLFDFMLSGGPQPRFWIDGTAHVTMARDRRTYRFLRETRLGRVTLAESTDPRILVDHVTDYVAERMVERDRAYASAEMVEDRLASRAQARLEAEPALAVHRTRPRAASAGLAALWLSLGILLGMGALAAFVSVDGTPLF